MKPAAGERALMAGAALILASVAALPSLRHDSGPFLPAEDDPRMVLRLELNRAGVEELEALPGVGPALAQRIARHRREHGHFRTLGDLSEVRGVGEKLVSRLRPHLAAGRGRGRSVSAVDDELGGGEKSPVER